MLTTNELLAKTGISYTMLENFKKLGLVPMPRVKGLGRGKGVVGLYNDDVIEIIHQIKDLQNERVPLRRIVQMSREERAALRVQVSSELVAPKPNSNLLNWFVNRFAELGKKYPEHHHGTMKIEEELPDGRVRISFWLSKKQKG